MQGGSLGEVELLKKRATSFLELARYSLQRGLYDVAAFNAEQAAQLYLKATLLELVGDFPRTHSIIFLLNELKRVSGKKVEDFVRENKRGLHVLEDAYLTSRYFYKLFDREDVEDLISLAEKVMDLCERLRRGLGESQGS
jgi:HEPN domain-containing protein